MNKCGNMECDEGFYVMNINCVLIYIDVYYIFMWILLHFVSSLNMSTDVYGFIFFIFIYIVSVTIKIVSLKKTRA